jgi:hydroxymethylbilane synthase
MTEKTRMIGTFEIGTLKIGTRGSPLALAQAHMVRDTLVAHWGEASAACIEIVILKTSGDRILDRPLAEVGGKGLFTKELEEALLDARIDVAVHSMKDVETTMPAALQIAAMVPREDPRDRLLGAYNTLAALPEGARVGTSSLRRAAQIKHYRPDVEIVPFRGNVGTRLAKLEQGEAHATILAAAGLNRLGYKELGHTLQVGTMLPAVAQGAVGLQIRRQDTKMLEILAPLDDIETHEAVACERVFLAELEGSCRTPIAAYAKYDARGTQILLKGEWLTPDGAHRFAGQRLGDASDAGAFAKDLAHEIKAKAQAAVGTAFFKQI